MTKLVRPQKISDQVLAVLEERIATGIYEEGSKLPPERTLAEEFGVSRPSVRVASVSYTHLTLPTILRV